MEFGKVEINYLSTIHFELPQEPVSNLEVLSKGKGNIKFYLGCAGTKEKLNHYARNYNCIELNGTYYSNPSAKQVELYNLAVPNDFKFVPKLPQAITHIKRLKDSTENLNEFITSINGLNHRLGPILLLLPPAMGAEYMPVIKEFINNFPSNKELFVELRQESWFKNGLNTELYSLLIEKKRGLVITDSAGRRDFIHMQLSIPECLVRFVGNGLHNSDYSRIDRWVEQIKAWKEKGMEKCYFFIHQQRSEDAEILLNHLKMKIGTANA